MTNKNIIFLTTIFLLIFLNGCKSEKDVNILREDAYNQGYYDAIDCDKRKGGSASSAADACENE